MAKKSKPNSTPPATMWRKTGASRDQDLARLRDRAEQKARALHSQVIEPQSPAEALQVLHELRVQQIELEMQNEEMRSTRERLEASRARYFDLYDLAPVGYLTLSKGGRILEANLTAATLLGVARTALSGRQLSRFVLADDANTFYSLVGNLSRKGGPESCELRMAGQGTEPFWAQLDAAAAQDVGGAPAWRVVISDITGRKRAQEESFARHKLESMGTLAGGIAHDFNNLLGGVLAHAELALEEFQSGSSPEEELKHIRDAIRGSEIVRQLMIYSGKESEAAGLVDVSEVAGGMIELLKASISKHATLVTDFGQDLPPVRGSTGQIQQIVMNLITNASETLDNRDGVIRVTTRHVNLGWAEAISKGTAEGDYVLLEVTDTGRGMSLETQAKVFDRSLRPSPWATASGLGWSAALCEVSAERFTLPASQEWAQRFRYSCAQPELHLSMRCAAGNWSGRPPKNLGR